MRPFEMLNFSLVLFLEFAGVFLKLTNAPHTLPNCHFLVQLARKTSTLEGWTF